MAEGLVGIGTSGGVGHRVLVVLGRGVRGAVVVTVGGLGGTGTQRLVGVRGLLSGDAATVVTLATAVVVGGAAGAAAHAEGPEEQSGQGEDDSEPGGGVHIPAHGEGDAVGVESGAGAGLHDGEEDGRGHGGGGGEEEGKESEQGGDAAAPAAADGEQADQDLDGGGDEGDDVGDEHPLGDGLVDLHNLAVVVRQLVLDDLVVQAPDLERVKVELAFRLRAFGRGVLVIGNVSIAVAPQTDRVEILQAAVTLEPGQYIRHLVRADAGDAVLVEDGLDFCCCF